MKEKELILVVDDAPDTREVLQRNLSIQGYRVLVAPGVAEAIQTLESNPVDLVITDYKMPRTTGMGLIRYVRDNLKHTEIIMVTGYASVEGAVEAVKLGADQYLPKPFTDEELLTAVRRALDKVRVHRATGGKDIDQNFVEYGLIGRSAPMQRVFESISKAASSSATVMVLGESGTGKELVARAIHYNSARSSASFVPVNCAAIPDGLLESELFGYTKGAFTGALESRAGFFQTADGGSIFLDEIGDTSLTMQAKLLRVLEDGEAIMLGSNRPRKLDVRVLAASNKDLQELLGKGTFREDLYFRINVITIELPPLRKRGHDISLLIDHFTRRFAAEQDRPPLPFSDSALDVLRRYHWPGNVRELQNVIHRLVVMAGDGDTIEAPDLPSLMRFSALRDGDWSRTLAEVEADYIRNVLSSVDGNKTRAAQILGIDRKTLRRKLDDLAGAPSP